MITNHNDDENNLFVAAREYYMAARDVIRQHHDEDDLDSVSSQENTSVFPGKWSFLNTTPLSFDPMSADDDYIVNPLLQERIEHCFADRNICNGLPLCDISDDGLEATTADIDHGHLKLRGSVSLHPNDINTWRITIDRQDEETYCRVGLAPKYLNNFLIRGAEYVWVEFYGILIKPDGIYRCIMYPDGSEVFKCLSTQQIVGPVTIKSIANTNECVRQLWCTVNGTDLDIICSDLPLDVELVPAVECVSHVNCVKHATVTLNV